MATNIKNNSEHTVNYRVGETSTNQSINTLENSKTIPINQALTDSLSLKIPLALCNVLDKRLTSLTAIYYETLDAVDCELLPPKPLVITQNGITCRFSLVEIPIWNNETQTKEQTKFINLTVSAKLLKERYFEGITKDNIAVLHQTFLNFEVFECDLSVFLGGVVSDIDICINRYCSSPKLFLDVCRSLWEQSGTKQKYLRLFPDANNMGLTFNSRVGARPSLPFIKAYHKELELLNKSADFFNAYLIPYSYAITGLTRVEATIKNYAHKKRLEKYNILPKFRTLGEYLEIDLGKLYDFLTFSISAYIQTKARIKAPNLSPSEHIIFELIQNCVLKGYDFESLLAIADTFKGSTPASTPVARSRMRAKITEIFDLLYEKDLKIQSKAMYNNHVLDYLRYLKIAV